MIRGLLEKARGKLAAAEDWLAQGRYFDDIASRCYYAAFHAAQAMLLTEGLTADTHQGIVSLFGLHFAKTGKVNPRLGRYLNDQVSCAPRCLPGTRRFNGFAYDFF